MAEDTNTLVASNTQTAQKLSNTNLLSIFHFLKDNFVFVSGIAVAAGLAFSTIFLSAYLFVFDWHLIWFVQSVDVLTFGLIAAGLIGSSLLLLYGMSHNVLSIRMPDGKLNWHLIIISSVAATLLLAFQIYGTHAGADPHYFHIVAGWVTIFSVVSILFVVGSHFDAGTWPTLPQSIGILFGAITATTSFGNWTALVVVESPEIAQDVVTKDQTLRGVKVVIVMSRHTVLLQNDDLLVIPTADITQFKGKGSVLVKIAPASEKKTDTTPPAPDKVK
jgi:hypothetical protein